MDMHEYRAASLRKVLECHRLALGHRLYFLLRVAHGLRQQEIAEAVPPDFCAGSPFPRLRVRSGRFPRIRPIDPAAAMLADVFVRRAYLGASQPLFGLAQAKRIEADMRALVSGKNLPELSADLLGRDQLDALRAQGTPDQRSATWIGWCCFLDDLGLRFNPALLEPKSSPDPVADVVATLAHAISW